MLSERQLENILDVFRKRMQGAVEQYLVKMGEHLRDIGTLTASDINRLVELKRVNYNMEQVKREIAKAAQASIKDIDAVFEAVAESDARFAADVFAADHTPLIKDNPTLERILKAQARITKQQLANLSQTTLLSVGYKNAVDLAVQTVQAGVTDYNSAIRKAMKAAASEGLRVKYPTGYTRRLDSAVRMNILDGVRAINQDVLYQLGKEFDADGVEISTHALCAEDHVPYQGLQMPIKEFEHLQNVILDRPFGMWNCRHTWHYILLGISEPRYTPQELAQYKRNSRERITIDGVTKSRYEWSQEQRRIETAIRYQKDIAVAAKASGDIVARRECAYMIRELDKRYAEISKAAGLVEKPERMRVSGFNKVKPLDELKKHAPTPTEHARLHRNYDNIVAVKALDAPGFVEKFNHITENDEVNNAIYASAVKMLKHRNGSNREDLYLINGKTGKVIHAHTTSDKDYAVVYDNALESAIAKAKQSNIPIIAIHNHPNGLPPTMDDGVSAFARKYDLGVVVGHNLEVFTYEKTSRSYSEEDCRTAHGIINQVIALEVDFDEEIWYNVLAKYGMKVRRIVDG